MTELICPPICQLYSLSPSEEGVSSQNFQHFRHERKKLTEACIYKQKLNKVRLHVQVDLVL